MGPNGAKFLPSYGMATLTILGRVTFLGMVTILRRAAIIGMVTTQEMVAVLGMFTILGDGYLILGL